MKAREACCPTVYEVQKVPRLTDSATITFGNMGPFTFFPLRGGGEVVKFCLFQKLVFDFFDFLINCIGFYFSLLFPIPYFFEVNLLSQVYKNEVS